MAVVGLIAGCPPSTPKQDTKVGGTTTIVEGGDTTAPYPIDFTPGPELEDPLPPDPNKFGLAYLELIGKKLTEPWSGFVSDCRLRLPPDHELNATSLAVTVALTVDRNGKLVEAAFVQSSGSGDFDDVAMEIARDAAPYPAPPKTLISDDDLAHITWLFARDRRQAGVATATIEHIEWPVDKAVPKYLAADDITTAAERLVAALESTTDPKQAEVLLGLADRIFAAAIRASLRSEDLNIQHVAVAAAAEARVVGAARELRSIADGSSDLPLRSAALDAIGTIGDADAESFLLEILTRDKGHNAEISGAAARSLAAIGKAAAARPMVQEWLQDDASESKWAALVVMAHFAVPKAVPALAKMVTAKDTERPMRMAACAALGTSAPAGNTKAAMSAVKAGLKRSDPAVRAACASAAATAAGGGVADRGTFWAMVELLKDRDERVRAAAVIAAARLDPTRFLKEMYLLKREKSAVVLAALAEGLAAVPGAAAYAKIVSLADHESAEVRRAVVAALLVRKEAKAGAAAAAMIDDSDVQVRADAIRAVTDAEALAQYLEDESPEIRFGALAGLVKVKGKLETLPQMMQGLATAPKLGAERARLGQAWLAP